MVKRARAAAAPVETLEAGEAASNVAEYSVSEISGALKRTVEDRFGHVRVRGEVSGYRGPHSSGHAYFALKDERARLEAVVWRTTFAKLAFKPEEGLEVVATGRLTTFPGSSKYQIVVEDMQPAGAGALMALLNERRLKLEAEGLFAPDRKRPLPFMPRVVGVVTSPTGAVIRDIRHRIADRFPLHVLVWPVRVQGETCGEEVAAAIDGFNAIEPGGPLPRPDVLIVARGGGSLEDLWGFNDEAVVRAAARSAIPLISAVGHETDWTLIDHAADRRAPTPTGAAEMAVPVRADLVAALAALDARSAAAVSRTLQAERRAVANLARALPSPGLLLSLPRRRLDEAETALGRALRFYAGERRRMLGEAGALLSPARLESAIRDRRADLRHAEGGMAHALGAALARQRHRLERLDAALRPHVVSARSDRARLRLAQAGERMDRAFRDLAERRKVALAGAWRVAASLDPRQVLERGYAIVRGADNTPITRADDLPPGTAFELEFARGHRRAAVALGTEGEAPRPAKAPRRRGATAPAGDQGDLF
ncbi:exodeoxyribonuclease VII large subunit [Aureimonas flava]|uniref:Exodeoxyribonuclease 7 large subunit n=1 Tax=Aureimonas flava TaxID=2320271 RepID=A0A3A1WVY6_9HYPH|nr:exodeoxyribonuclease VII large subunit [Aureimonas flava]RIY02518.1 exodeoxyribonuclease VII large subunit [Aureimonas flava]